MHQDGAASFMEPSRDTKSSRSLDATQTYPDARAPQARDSSTEKSAPRASRRKKASRACYHCQKAHLTCDDARPCQRCIRKGLADQCVDGYRKKAKYLLEEDELRTCGYIDSATQPNVTNPPENPHEPKIFSTNAASRIDLQPIPTQYASPSALFQPAQHTTLLQQPHPVSMDATTSSGYDPTWLECSIINSMLHDADAHVLSSESPDVPTAPAMELMDSYTLVNQVFPQEISEDKLMAPSVSWDAPSVTRSSNEAPSLPEITKPPEYPMNDLASRFENPPFQAMATTSRSPWQQAVSPSQLTQTDHAPSGSNQRQESTVHPTTHVTHPDHLWKERVAKVYREDLKPFRYTEGYHILLKYVTQKFDKADVLRIMALSEEDEKFVERAFQRTMLEFEKLISFSGTPTVVWRRTCEICVVGAEFCMLTQWSKENLLGQYMYQFMDRDSVLRYWYVSMSDLGNNLPVMRLKIRHRP